MRDQGGGRATRGEPAARLRDEAANRTRPDYWPAADGPVDQAVRDGRAVHGGGAAVHGGLPANFYFAFFFVTDAPVSFGRSGLLTFICVLLGDRHTNEFASNNSHSGRIR